VTVTPPSLSQLSKDTAVTAVSDSGGGGGGGVCSEGWGCLIIMNFEM
jgi:hypothetical protein